MKAFKKLFALVLAFVMTLGMGTQVFAASITVNQDDTYGGEDGQAGRTFTYSQIFHATLSKANTSTGGGYDDTDGSPGDVTASLQKGYSYFLDAEEDVAQIAQLGTWDATAKTWTKATGNLWFKLTPTADGSQYIVEWDNAATDTDAAQAAAKWLAVPANYTPLTSGSLTWDATSKSWKAEGLEDGYYLLSSNTGNNLIAATGDIVVNEKNDYPPLEKEEEDEDNITIVDTETGEALNVAIGDVIDYTVTVKIPATAKTGETIEVWDKPSRGLTYNNNVTADPATDVTDGTVGTDEAWHKVITVTDTNKGTEIVFSYSMTINDEALVDLDRMNEAGLKYSDEYESVPHSVKYTTYFGGILKIDGDTEEPLEGVEFLLKENGSDFKVSKSGNYYIPDAEGSATVVTDADGLIVIRGLDKDKTYTLTETKTLAGYNMITGDVTLTLTEDVGSAYADMTPQEYQPVENNKGIVLPSTGGIGTTIFYILGSLLVIGAGVVLVTRRRLDA